MFSTQICIKKQLRNCSSCGIALQLTSPNSLAWLQAIVGDCWRRTGCTVLAVVGIRRGIRGNLAAFSECSQMSRVVEL